VFWVYQLLKRSSAQYAWSAKFLFPPQRRFHKRSEIERTRQVRLASAPLATEAKAPMVVMAAATAIITERSPYIAICRRK
jgi:hypothetical protein